ncbi:MAG TPA: TlyA family RNA methyltransferase [Chloroflexota bacterium]|nr:TlyA family RNA methyltransferase [Chloroflexota bacterium]
MPDTKRGEPSGRRQRLDLALVDRGLEASRERARALIVAGEVAVNGQRVTAPSTLVLPDADIAVGKQLPYVSRGGLKLAHALDTFHLDPTGRVCLDAGASTGGFTDVLLQRGAARVYAVDVGKGQLAWTLRTDPRVVVMEGINARHLTPGQLPEPASLVVADLAFISLRLVLTALTTVMADQADLVALVKPQFEAGASDVGKGGVVRNPDVHRRVLLEVIAAAQQLGLPLAGLTPSPIRGQAGNVEFLMWAARRPAALLDPQRAVAAALSEVPASVH